MLVAGTAEIFDLRFEESSEVFEYPLRGDVVQKFALFQEGFEEWLEKEVRQAVDPLNLIFEN